MTGSIAAVVFLTLIACLVLTVPIGFSLGIASLGYILYTKSQRVQILHLGGKRRTPRKRQKPFRRAFLRYYWRHLYSH